MLVFGTCLARTEVAQCDLSGQRFPVQSDESPDSGGGVEREMGGAGGGHLRRVVRHPGAIRMGHQAVGEDNTASNGNLQAKKSLKFIENY